VPDVLRLDVHTRNARVRITPARLSVKVRSGGASGAPGPPGPPGPPGVGGGSFVWDQTSASALWDVVHNLGYFPNVTTVDSAGTSVEGVIRYLSANELTVEFGAPFAGQAFLS